MLLAHLSKWNCIWFVFQVADLIVLFLHLHVDRVEFVREQHTNEDWEDSVETRPDEVKAEVWPIGHQVYTHIRLAHSSDHPRKCQHQIQGQGDTETERPFFWNHVLKKRHGINFRSSSLVHDLFELIQLRLILLCLSVKGVQLEHEDYTAGDHEDRTKYSPDVVICNNPILKNIASL